MTRVLGCQPWEHGESGILSSAGLKSIFDNSVAPYKPMRGGASPFGETLSLQQRRKSLRTSSLSLVVRRPQTLLASSQACGLRSTGHETIFLKGLILAQNERWRRGLGMQVERIPGGLLSGGSGERGSKAWVTYPRDGDSHSNEWVIPGELSGPPGLLRKGISPGEGLTWY